MILYLSSAIPDDMFAIFLKDGCINCGHQAQKFNSLVIKGIAFHTAVEIISNPPYSIDANAQESRQVHYGNMHYHVLGTNKGKLHKLGNFREMLNTARKICDINVPETIICDAINPLASLCGIITSRKKHIPSIAIVTDIPEYMDEGRETIFTRITSWLMSKYDGYVLLTEAMNKHVNLNAKPYIIMEGLCDAESLSNAQECEKCKNGSFTCVYTGSLSKNTGIEELVDAFADEDLKCADLRIYGGGQLAEKLKKYEKRYANINYMGIVNNKEAVKAQRKADLLINPRPTDISYGNLSFPSKIMEYMVSGTPVLTTRLPGIPREYFEYMYTVDDNSISSLQDAIKMIMGYTAEERENKGKRARKYVLGEKNCIVQATRILELVGKL